MPSRAWKMAQLPPLFQFSVKGNKFSLEREREDTTRKFFRVNFLIESIDSINEIGSDFIGQNYMKSINSDFLID